MKLIFKNPEAGNAMAYILAVIFLLGALMITMTSGSKKNIVSTQLDELTNLVYADIMLIETAIQECVLTYPDAVDIDGDGNISTSSDNINPGYPIGDVGVGEGYTLGFSFTANAPLSVIRCPGAPGLPDVLDNKRSQGLRILNTTAYPVVYTSLGGPLIYFDIGKASDTAQWTEVIARLDDRFSECKAEAVVNASCSTGAGDCLRYYLKPGTGNTPPCD